MTGIPADQGGAKRRRAWWRRWWVWYAVLLAASHAAPALRPVGPAEVPTMATRAVVEVSDGSAAQSRVESGAAPVKLSYLEWGSTGSQTPPSEATKPPVILLHGSPGAAEDFAKLGPLLAGDRRVIAIDQLGFGESSRWVADYSIRADARAVLALMDQLGIARAHIVGWSNGGGTALNMADLAPQRLASLTMMASIGDQQTEGSQSHFFEHAKYGVGLAAAYGAELIPDFGLLGPLWFRHSAIRFFLDSDQRPLTQIMERTRVPVLILHGRHDFLVPAWQAERHHAMMPTSRLVMLDASHFLPFMQDRESAEWIGGFIREHDEPGEPGVAPRTDILNLSPVGPPRDIEHLTRPIGAWLTRIPWTVEVGLLVLLSLLSPAGAAVLAALFVGNLTLNFSVAWVGLVAGRLVRTWGATALARVSVKHRLGPDLATDWARRLSERPARAGWMAALFPPLRREAGWAVATVGRAPGLFIMANVLGAVVASLVALLSPLIVIGFLDDPARRALGWPGMAAVLTLAWAAARHLPTLLTRLGRQRLRGQNSRLWRREYWPAFIFYLPLAPYMIYLAIKHRGLTLPTCVNPGIEAGGGMVGESKHAIMQRLAAGRTTVSGASGADDAVIATVYIAEDPDPQRRARQVIDAMSKDPRLASFPLILKPDSGQRGFGVKLVRSVDEVAAYFREMTRSAIVQPYHPGPYECGVLWVRCLETLKHGRGTAASDQQSIHRPVEGPVGFVYSITDKEFPSLVADGVRTLEELVYAQRRFRRQADIFLARFASERSRVPAAGEPIRLCTSGNHCQGTLFRDGGELLTPSLARAFDALAGTFPSNRPAGGHDGLDFGRFDVRYESPEEFRRGRGFSIVELNGATGESTNLYDPKRSILWSYRVLFGQWRHLYELGAARRDAGATPMSRAELIRAIRAHYRTRSGSALAD